MSGLPVIIAQASELDPVPTPDIDLGAFLPLIALVGGAILLLTAASLLKGRLPSGFYATFTVVAALAAIVSALPLWQRVTDDADGPFTTVNDAFAVDGFSVFLTIVICGSVVLAALVADGYLRREGQDGPELYVLMLLSAAGGVLMAGANDMIVLFLGLETLSIAAYVLAAMQRRRAASTEAGMKYFVLGAFSSAFLLYGIAFIYGATGSTNFSVIADYKDALLGTDNGFLLVGIALVIVGLGFKVAAVPFHAWTPDVYDGAPTPVVAYMASGIKAAGFAALVRVLVVTFGLYEADWQPILAVLAALTLLLGSTVAVVQTNIKRMLAYSSLNHAGFMLVAVTASSDRGVGAVLFYLAAYTFLVVGSFAVATVVGRTGDGRHDLDEYRGLARVQPWLAGAMLLFLLAQAGVPFTSGFYAKLDVIGAAVESEYYWLALVAMVSAVIAAFVYLRIVVAMFLLDPDEDVEDDEPVVVPAGTRLALGAAFLATLWMGLVPWIVGDWADEATPSVAPAAEAPPDPAELLPPPPGG